ncbi:MAG: hypothetical protein WKF37_19085 [Bryobacteraceae bacterium]
MQENLRFTSGFAGGWRNNDSLFGLILYVAGDPGKAKMAVLSLISVSSLLIAAQRWQLETKFLATAVCILALSSNCHPWYLSWFLPLLAFERHVALLLWVALAPLSYNVWIQWTALGEWDGSTPWRWLIYVPVLALILLRFGLRTTPGMVQYK